jgi:hypothetical protein
VGNYNIRGKAEGPQWGFGSMTRQPLASTNDVPGTSIGLNRRPWNLQYQTHVRGCAEVFDEQCAKILMKESTIYEFH